MSGRHARTLGKARLCAMALVALAALLSLAVPAGPARGLELPSLARLEAMRGTRAQAAFQVEQIQLEGPRVLLAAIEAEVLAAYQGRALTSLDLAALRDDLTAQLIDAGFVTSGARIPRQEIEQGRLRVELIAGRLDRVVVEGAAYFDEDRLAARIQGSPDAPLHLKRLERRLQWIAHEPLVDRLSARLEPGLNPGEAVLRVQLVERAPHRAEVRLANDAVSSIGSERLRLFLGHDNLLGYRDSLETYFGKTPGLDEWKVRYELPINRLDTRIYGSYRDSRSQIVHSDLDRSVIRLESRSRTISLGIRQPIRLGRRTELWVGVRGDLRRAQSRVNDFGFFLTPGEDEDGRVRASILRVVQGLTARKRQWVASVRSTVSIGLDLFDASDGEISLGGPTPDGTFVSWLGQFQGAWRLPARWGRLQLAARADVQLTRVPLLAMERIGIGGQRTVRGYPENAIVRDNGAAFGVELRIPFLPEREDGWSLHFIPFVDGGLAWNDGARREREWLASAGLGLRSRWRDQFHIDVQWGGRLLDADDFPSRGLQKHGFHVSAEMRL